MNKINENWLEENQRYLLAAIAEIRVMLKKHCQGGSGEDIAADPLLKPNTTSKISARDMTPAPALQTLCKLFGLSGFERALLLLCAGIELDNKFPDLCAAVQANSSQIYPTFALALAALPGPYWSTLAPSAPLRYWRLIEVEAGSSLTRNPLKIDERVLHYLTGIQHLDDRLLGIVEPVQAAGELVPSHQRIAERAAMTWSKAQEGTGLPILQLCGTEISDKLDIAAAACSMVGLNLQIMAGHAVPVNPAELHGLIRLWEREATLSASALLLDCGETDTHDSARENAVSTLIEKLTCPLIVASYQRRFTRNQPMISFDVGKSTTGEQRKIWKKVLGDKDTDVNGHVGSLISQFNLNRSAIYAVSSEALAGIQPIASSIKNQKSDHDSHFSKTLWNACKVQARPRMDNLARRIESSATWDDLVIPEQEIKALHEIVVHVSQRMKVYEDWGFAAKCSRGLGISALFSGASGTGKTLASEVLANELNLDLYCIDLSAVVSKYIGETEKNLRRVFDAAEGGGVILLFDEADALFGKRSEVKDSHDRYANIEISYLLQRMEAYRGLAILTTNMKNALDTAFLRRIRFIVQFPFPDAAERAEIWRRIFPTDTPKKDLEVAKLARLNVPGGNIRNIAMNAAFIAAEAGEQVGMQHLLRAARSEYMKMEKPLTQAEIQGWV